MHGGRRSCREKRGRRRRGERKIDEACKDDMSSSNVGLVAQRRKAITTTFPAALCTDEAMIDDVDDAMHDEGRSSMPLAKGVQTKLMLSLEVARVTGPGSVEFLRRTRTPHTPHIPRSPRGLAPAPTTRREARRLRSEGASRGLKEAEVRATARMRFKRAVRHHMDLHGSSGCKAPREARLFAERKNARKSRVGGRIANPHIVQTLPSLDGSAQCSQPLPAASSLFLFPVLPCRRVAAETGCGGVETAAARAGE